MTTTAHPGPAGTVVPQPVPAAVAPPVPPSLTVLPGGIRMWAPDHEPPAVPPGTWVTTRPVPVPHQPVPADRAASTELTGPTEPSGPWVPTEPADRDEARGRAAALTRLVTEVLVGRRAPGHLTGVATPAVLRYLTSGRPGSPVRRPRPSGPGGRAGAPGCAPAAATRRPRLHVGHPHPDAAEVCTTVRVADRIRALALRLDRAGAGAPWTVTAVRLL